MPFAPSSGLVIMLYLYVIRHAEAVPTDDPQYQDEERPLTELGHSQARALGQALTRQGIRFDLIVTSPLVRAAQTAEEILAQLPDPKPALETSKYLIPGTKSRKIDRDLLKYDGNHIAIVGHEPDLSEYIGRLLGSKKIAVHMAKGGIACVACEDPPGKGCGTLEWLLMPEWYGSSRKAPKPSQPEG